MTDFPVKPRQVRCHKPSHEPKDIRFLKGYTQFHEKLQIGWFIMVYWCSLLGPLKKNNNLFASATAYGLATLSSRRRPIYATDKPSAEANGGPTAGRMWYSSPWGGDVGKMVKKMMKHDETIKHGGKNGWFHSFGESVREDVETWSTKWMKTTKVLEKIVL